MKALFSLFIICLATWCIPAKADYGISTSATEDQRIFKKARIGTKKVRKEYRFVKKSGKLSLDLGNVKIEGYNGDEVIISMMVESSEVDERAAGLQGISGSGFVDNTNMGLHISHKGDLTDIRLIAPPSQDSILVKVPKNLALSVKNKINMAGDGTIRISNVQGEIEVSSTLGNVKLENVRGPMTVKTVQGNVEAVFNAPVKGPISIISTLGFIDVALPVKTAANLQMNTTLGNLYAAEDFKIEIAPLREEQKRAIVISTPHRKEKSEKDSTGAHPVNMEDAIEEMVNQSLKAAEQSLEALSQTKEFENIIPKNFSFEYKVGNRVQGKINGGGEDIILRTTNGAIYLRTTSR